MKSTLRLLIPLLALISVFSACHTTKSGNALVPRAVFLDDPYIGDWDFVIKDMPSGDAKGILYIEREGYAYRGSVAVDNGETDINKLSIEESRMRGYFKYKGFKVNVKGVFEGDTFEGKVGVTLISYPFVATKRNASVSAD
ncbi:MAG: hypothetical protein HKN76_19355 [Saprospiraceae bacterium]|nr:hypothetical protein [Saprospiraceae bacterium]